MVSLTILLHQSSLLGVSIAHLIGSEKHGTLRYCFGYRKLDSITIKDVYFIPRMDQCIYT